MPFLKRGKDKQAGADSLTTLFFASDLHGSEQCWRKFLRAGRFYGVGSLVMGGDLTGKAVVPITRKPDGSCSARLLGEIREAASEEAIAQLMEAVRYNGMYPWIASEEEIDRHRDDDISRTALFEALMLDELRRWVALGDETARKDGIEVFAIAGNDDLWSCDSVLAEGELLQHCEDRVVHVGSHEMVSCSYANPTPWDSPREMTEEALYEHLKQLVEQVEEPRKAIFLFHVPPYDSKLDMARELNPDLTVAIRRGQPNEIPVGSHAVRQIIEEYQPLLSLHGHIHESRGVVTIGKTVSINPGSEYYGGRLQGALIKLAEEEVKIKQLVVG